MQDERVLISPSWHQRLQNENYKNWLKVGYGIDLVCKAIRPYVEKEAKAFHGILTTRLHGFPLCTCTYTGPPYHDTINCLWAKELLNYHAAKGKPKWKQSDASLWNDPNVGHWEVAKLYMPYGGNSCAETDATGLLNLLCWCIYFKTDRTLVEKFRDTRNAWGHAPKHELDAAETNDAFLSMRNILQDAELVTDPDAIDALNELTRLETENLIDFKDIEAQVINHLKLFIISIKDEIIEKVHQNAALATEIKDILQFCMKCDADRDNVLSDIQNSIERIELREQEKSKQNRWIMNTFEKICSSLLSLVLIVYLALGRIIPCRARVLFLILVLGVTILEENVVDFGCERIKLDDPFELKQFDFTEYLNRAREGFVGRQWLFNNITESLEKKHKESRGVMVVGAPGFGKSALISNLICSKLSRFPIHSQILGYHFCIHSDKNTLNGAKFVRNLANMVASRLRDYENLLSKEKFILRILKVECLGDPTGCFEQGILAPLLKLQLRFEAPMYIVVDALDECLDEKEQNTGRSIVDILHHKIKKFPSWLKVIATSRNHSNIRRKLSNLDVTELHQDDPNNLRDIERFLTSKLKGSIVSRVKKYFLSGTSLSVSDLVQKSQGNFLYIKLILEYLLTRDFTSDKISLPDSINSVYQDFFERKYDSVEKFRAPRKIFEILVATKSPVTVMELYDILSNENKDFDFDYDLLPVLEDLSMYLLYAEEKESKVRVFHSSLTEWLTCDSNKGGIFYVSEKRGSRALANHFLKVIHGNFSKVNPKFIYDLTVYIVVGGHLKKHTDSFLKIDPKLIKVKDKRTGFTALHLAAEADNEKVLGMLLNIFNDVNVEDSKGRTAAFMAVAFGRFNNLRLLHEKGASLTQVTKKHLTVVKKGVVDETLECKQQMCGYSLLHVAAQKGHKDIVEYLIKHGSDVSLLSAARNSAVQLAAEFGHIEIMKLLLSHGANVDNTCLYYAALYGQAEIVKFLLKKGVKDSCIPCDGIILVSDFMRDCNTALHAAAIGDFPDVINTLLTSKHNAANCVNYFGKEPIHEAVHHNNYRAVNEFLKQGVDTSRTCKFFAKNGFLLDLKFFGFTPLHLAAYHGFTAITGLLLEHNADYNATDGKGLQPIHVASCHGHGDVLSVLVKSGADINSKDPNGMTPIHYACKCKASQIFDKLFELGADGLALTADGKTPFHFLVQDYFMDKKYYFVDPYAEHPIDPVTFDFSKDKVVKSHMREHSWLISTTKFLQSVTKSDISLSELGALLGPFQYFLSYGSVLPNSIIHEISMILLGSDSHTNSRLVVLSTPAPFPVDIGLAAFLKNQHKNLNQLSTSTVLPHFMKKSLSTALMTVTGKVNFKCSMLVTFIHHNMVYAVDASLQLGMDVNCEESGLSPLLAYLRQGGRNMAKVLAKHAVTVDIQCGEYFEDSVFHLAAYHKLHYLQYLSIFEDPINWEEYLKEENALFDYLFDVYNEVSTEGQFRLTRVRDGPVTIAVKSDFRGFKIIDECLDNEGYTALQRAAQGGNVVAVKHFLDRGANATKESPEGFDILTLTIWFAVKYRPFPNFHETSLLSSLEIEFASLTAGVILRHLTKNKLFDIGCNPNRKNPTLLHLAATRGMWRFIDDLFIARERSKVTGLTANCPTKDNITPMYLAKLHGGDACDWDNPWCKVVGVLSQYEGTMIYPDQTTEYLFIFNNLFQNLPERFDLDLDEKEIQMLRGDHKECYNVRFKNIASEMIALNLTKDLSHLIKKRSHRLELGDLMFSLKASKYNSDLLFLGIKESKFVETKLMYNLFLTTKIFTLKGIFMFMKELKGMFRCVTVRFDANSKYHGITDDTPPLLQPESCKKHFPTETDDHGIELDTMTMHIPDMCSSKTEVYFEMLDQLLDKNRRSYNSRCKTFIKTFKDLEFSSKQFLSEWDSEYSLAVENMFHRYEKKMFCEQKEVTYRYARLKYILHTLKFWSSQVKRNKIYPILSKFTLDRITRVILSNNKKQTINLLLKLAKVDPLNEYEYMEMFRFSDPPLKEVFKK